MPASRAGWWVHRDVRRVLGRARHSAGKYITVDELRYLRAQCLLLLTNPLAVEPEDAADLRDLLACLEDAMCQAAEWEDGTR